MPLPQLYPAQVGSPYTTLSAPYTAGNPTMAVADASILPPATNVVCLAGVADDGSEGEFTFSGKSGDTLTGIVQVGGPTDATWPAGTFVYRGGAAYDHDSVVEHLTYQRSHLTEAVSDLSSNLSYTGSILADAEAGEALVFGDVAVLAESGKFVKADPATLATLDGTVALVVSDSIAPGGRGEYLIRGLARNDSWSFAQGRELYAGAGTLTHEPPAVGTQLIRKMGTALSSTIIEFAPSSTIHAEHLISVLPVTAVTKDNGDIERKFFKDDFSVDSSADYATTSDSAVEYTAGVLKWHKPTINNASISNPNFKITTGKITLQLNAGIDTILDAYSRDYSIIFYDGSGTVVGVLAVSYSPNNSSYRRVGLWSSVLHQYNTDASHIVSSTAFTGDKVRDITLEVDLTPSGQIIATRIDRSTGASASATFTNPWVGRIASFGLGGTPSHYGGINYHSIDIAPTVAYTDPFTTDTVSGANGRYQAVTGTVAYDDVNKRMNVTTATGANGKTSGRLKSYKFTEGSQIYDVTLPTGADGDFITLVTHSANGLMTDGIGVGLQSDGAGNWNLATLSNTTVTVGASSGLVDGKTARIKIEKDVTGAYWYYIYDAAGTKPTTATGKLFTTLTEGYTGWYANGAGATTQTYAIDNISIRAESIVGRTNVELTEEVFNSVTGEMETRTYFKPIHRGSMLETYFDGTQEVVGTTFVDDCQWNRLSEYESTSEFTRTHNTAEGCYNLLVIGNPGSSKRLKPKGNLVMGEGVYKFTYRIPTGVTTLKPVYFRANGIPIILRSGTTYIGDTTINSTAILVANTWYKIEVVHTGTTVYLYRDGALVGSATGVTTTPEIPYLYQMGDDDWTNIQFDIKDIQFIAASPDTTNGIAACIPPIGGGARYGVEESVYIPITPGTEIPVGSAVISPNAKSTVVGTALTAFAQTPAGVSASLEYATGTKACPGLSTAFAPAGRHLVKADRNTPTNIGVKGSVAGISPAVYIDSLHVRKQEAA